MKKNISVLIMILALTSSCDDILDKTPQDALTVEQAFVTEQNLLMYINSLYEMRCTFPPASAIYGSPETSGYYRMLWVGENVTDLTSNGSFVEDYISPGFFTSNMEDYWTWDELRKINYFLDNYKRSEAPENIKNHYAGIARWFRAKFYFDKVKRFGDVPWYGRTLGSKDEDLYKARDPRVLVMDSVLADLNFACANINPTKDNTSTVITKWVALGLKSRICLFEGTFRKYHPEIGLSGTANTWLQYAADAAQEVMESAQYSIYSKNKPDKDYHDLFISDNPVSTEIMLCQAFSETELVFHGATNFYSNIRGQYMSSLIKRFVNTYLNIDGSRFTDIPGYDTIFFTREVKNRDLRLSQTIRTPMYVRTDGTTPAPYGPYSQTLYHPIKWSHPDPYFDAVTRNVNALSLMRYTEIVLNYAEAKAELGTFTEADWNNTIGLLRKRAGITNTAMPGTLDSYLKDNFYENVTSIPIMEIRRDRAIELIYENFRYDDLVRWKQAHNLTKINDGIYVPEMNKLYDLTDDGTYDIAWVTQVPANRVPGVFYMVIDNTLLKLKEGTKGNILVKPNMVKEFPDYKYFHPIPYLQLQLNTNLVQNEGWDHP